MDKRSKWQNGNQYNKLSLWRFKILNMVFDAFVLHYPKPTILGWHRDYVEGASHYRINIKLMGKSTFLIEGKKRQKVIRFPIIFFRSDLYPHSVEVETPTIKISLGFLYYKQRRVEQNI